LRDKRATPREDNIVLVGSWEKREEIPGSGLWIRLHRNLPALHNHQIVMADPVEGKQSEQDFNEWNLEAGAEFRFELEQGASLAIKVSAE
jgi:hypothetical protein